MSMPEAKSSVTYTLINKDGYQLLFTVREENEMTLLGVMKDLEEGFKARGYQPSSYSTRMETGKPQTNAQSELAPYPATEKQEYVLKQAGRWKDGMSKAEATKLISEIKG